MEGAGTSSKIRHAVAECDAGTVEGGVRPVSVARPSRRSLSALDLLNMTVGDVGSGVGLYLSVYLLSNLHWDHGSIGVALSALSIASIAAQVPAGMLTDCVHRKRLLVAVPLLVLAACSFAITQARSFTAVIVIQTAAGIALSIAAAAIIGITLGLVGAERFAARIGRNEAFNHCGNVLVAVCAAALGYYLSLRSIFLFIGAVALMGAVAALAIKPADIDYRRARASEPFNNLAVPLRVVITNKRIAGFCCALMFWHLANAALCPLAGQYVAELNPGTAGFSMSACILAAQLVMIPAALISGKLAVSCGRRPLVLAAFAILPVRALLYTLSAHPLVVMAIQLLDGAGAGILGVLTSVVIADAAAGTGRYNAARSMASVAQGVGAAFSNLLAGWIVACYGYAICFYSLAAIAAFALIICQFAMQESGSNLASQPQ